MSANDFETIKDRNKLEYNTIAREYNRSYGDSDLTKDDIKDFDDSVFDGKLINECGIIQIIEHGAYNDIDELKHKSHKSDKLHKFDKFDKSPKSHHPLPVPVIFLSGKIGYSSFMMPDEQIEASVPIIDELAYNSLLTPINRKKQIQKVAHKLRLLHKHYLQLQIDKLLLIETTDPRIIEKKKNDIKELKREMKMTYGFFNPYNLKRGDRIHKYLTFMEGEKAPEYERTRGIFDVNGADYFDSYVAENISIKGDMNGTPFTMINLGDLIHICI